MDRINLVMCRSCGNFVEVFEEGENLTLKEDECPDCGGAEFKNTETGEVIRADD